LYLQEETIVLWNALKIEELSSSLISHQNTHAFSLETHLPRVIETVLASLNGVYVKEDTQTIPKAK